MDNDHNSEVEKLADNLSKVTLSHYANLFLKLSECQSASRDDLATRRKGQFPISFDDSRVEKQDCQPIGDSADDRKSVSHGRRTCSVRLDDNSEVQSQTSKSQSQRSKTSKTSGGPQMTPSKRTGRGEKSAKGWLLGWLVLAKMFHCHVTEFKPCCPLAVQLAHILVSKADGENDLLLSFYEFILGMKLKSLCIHSRLFLLPLKGTVHSALDYHLFVIIPCLPLLRQINQYFLAVLTAKHSLDEKEQEKGTKLWVDLREGKIKGLENFKDGNLHEYHAVPRAGTIIETRFELTPFPSFYSHLSPFAALLNAFRTLQVWKEGHESTSFISNASPRLFDALQEARTPQAQEITEAIASIHTTLMWLTSRFGTNFKNSKFQKGSGGGGAGASTGEGRGGGNAADKLKKYGVDSGLDFSGGGNGGGDRDSGGDRGSGGTGAVDAGSSLSYAESTKSDAFEEPREGVELFLVPHDSVVSVWSDNDSVRGVIAAEPNFHDPSSGPSPAQQIADEWRRANTSPTTTKPASVPSAPSFASSTTVTPTLPLSTFSSRKSRDGKENCPNKSCAQRRWGSKTRASLKGSRSVVLRIFGELNFD